MTRNAASERQVQAARPDMSTWLAANAGSGKTRVLTDRVARLLLDGTDPQKILCLTYTKAAAGEMQNRLFQRLGEWAMLSDQSLKKALSELGVQAATTPDQLRRARTLFARAIETPGGLKIQTIHSFCASLLRRFPLEAGVSPAFREMDDRAAALLHDDLLTEMAEGPDKPVLDDLCALVDDQSLTKLIQAIVGLRDQFETAMDWDALAAHLDLPPGFDRQALERAVFAGDEARLIADLIPILRAHSKTDQKAADKLAQITALDAKALPVLEGLFLFGPTAKTPFLAKLESFPTKKCQAALDIHLDTLHDLMTRVEAARPQRLALATVQKSATLHRFAQAFLRKLAVHKQARGWLDFDDLIRKARQLLHTPEVADWVLFRLDGGIDHILVDEAQDTSPEQWDVIEKLAREFTTGAGARDDVERTLFVVGDKKQSIYSFQGADPDAFDQMQAEFQARFRQIGSDLQDLTLEYSFRSSDAVLRLVDLVFEGREASGFARDALHRAFKTELPGRVDLWPALEEVKDNDDRHWTDPVDRPGSKHHTVQLAEQIAAQIEHALAHDTIPVDGPNGSFQRRPVQPGDFLILLQRRSDLFAEIIRACKSKNLPIAGADRLRVGAELAVRDLAALLRFLATPEDSLSLAEALRSPLLGWDEQALFDLAHRREGPFLWQALRDRRAAHPDTLAMLDDLRGQTDFLRPYDLIERILTRHDGRKRLLARLGPEAEDGINALLSQALAYEQNQIPSLTGFLVWMETDDLEIKRQADGSGDLIRVMTVHGSKGLEAPIVILPDTAVRRAPRGSAIMLADGVPLWRPPAAEMPGPISPFAEAQRERELRERDRLLYVALTRAEKWLIVAAAGKTGEPGDSWYADIAEAMPRAGAVAHDLPTGRGLRLAHLEWDGGEMAPPKQTALPDAEPVVWPEMTYAEPDTEVINPSDLGGAKALPGEDGQDSDTAMARGTWVHLLLEHLPAYPPADWPAVASALLPPEAGPDILAEAQAVLTAAPLQFIFDPDTLAEVEISAQLGKWQIRGTIDRLVIEPGRILAIDFKSNAVVPSTATDCPEGVLRQLGAYAYGLQAIYPDHQIETAIVWTRTATLMRVPHDLVTGALARTGWVDAAGGAT